MLHLGTPHPRPLPIIELIEIPAVFTVTDQPTQEDVPIGIIIIMIMILSYPIYGPEIITDAIIGLTDIV